MTRVRTSDLEDVLAFLGDLNELGADEPFPPENARVQRLLRSALAALEYVSDAHDVPAVVLVGPSGDVDFVAPAAFPLLAKYVGDIGARLPPVLEDWWRGGARSPFTLRSDGYQLVVDAVGPGRSALLVSEEPSLAIQLTAREWDVMRCVEAGQTNDEIADLLQITASTVKKHLEHVYAKLGVRTRTSAVARLRPAFATRAPSRAETENARGLPRTGT